MNIFKKAAACLAAAAVMTSVTVIASAEYRMNGMRADDKYLIRVVGLPETVLYHSDFEVVSALLTLFSKKRTSKCSEVRFFPLSAALLTKEIPI